MPSVSIVVRTLCDIVTACAPRLRACPRAPPAARAPVDPRFSGGLRPAGPPNTLARGDPNAPLRSRGSLAALVRCPACRSFVRPTAALGFRRPRELLSILLRNVRDGHVLTELERADVGRDRPAVARRDLRLVVRH